MRSYYSHGEAVALLPMISPAGADDADEGQADPGAQADAGQRRLAHVSGRHHDRRWGMPVSYRLSLRVQQAYEEIVDIRARDGAGRPQVIHVFDGEIEQMRGITPLAPALKIAPQYDQLSDATLTASLIQRSSPRRSKATRRPTRLAGVAGRRRTGRRRRQHEGLLDAKAGWYQNTKIDLGRAGKIAHLFPGEKLTFNGAKTPNATYEAFAKFLLREIARCLGMTFETLTGDYTAATYSSVRMSTSELWPLTFRAATKSRAASISKSSKLGWKNRSKPGKSPSRRLLWLSCQPAGRVAR
jgi:capsid protein